MPSFNSSSRHTVNQRPILDLDADLGPWPPPQPDPGQVEPHRPEEPPPPKFPPVPKPG